MTFTRTIAQAYVKKNKKRRTRTKGTMDGLDAVNESSKHVGAVKYEGKTKYQAVVKSAFLAACWICLVRFCGLLNIW